jgi:hypothetical protein
MTAPTIDTALTEIEFLPDYCPACNPAGHHADSCHRRATLTEPDAIHWNGGPRLRCDYDCARCRHQWTRRDLWDARSAGFEPTRSAA